MRRAPSDPSTRAGGGSYARTHARIDAGSHTNAETYAHARRERTSMRTDARRTSRRAENGGYCYGHYLPLIRTGGGRFSCERARRFNGAYTCALRTRMCETGCVQREEKREKDRRGSRVAARHRDERDTPQPDCGCRCRRRRAPRPDPRDFQDTRHTTHEPRTLCGVKQLDPSSLRTRYRYNGAAGAAKLS